MGRVVCDKHGRQSLAQLCPHLLAAFQANQAPASAREARIHEGNVGDTLGIWLCSECEAAADLPADLRVHMNETSADHLFTHPGGPACIVCFDEWRGGLK